MTMDVGLRAIFEPVFDKDATRRSMKELEKDMDKHDELDLDVDLSKVEDKLDKLPTEIDFTGVLDNDFVNNLMGRGRGGANLEDGGLQDAVMNQAFAEGAGAAGARMGGPAARGAGTAAGAAGGMLGRAGGAAKGILGSASSVALPVMLAGAIGIGLLKGIQKIASYSPKATKAFDMIGKAWELFWRPFGNFLGSVLMPYAEAALKSMAKFNQIFGEHGFTAAMDYLAKKLLMDLPVAIAKALLVDLPIAIGRAIMNYVSGIFSQLVSGDKDEQKDAAAGIGTIIGGGIGALLGGPIGMAIGAALGNLTGQLVVEFIDMLNGVDWGGIMSDLFGSKGQMVVDAIHELFPEMSASQLLGAIMFPTIGAPLLLQHINWPAADSILGEMGFGTSSTLIGKFNSALRGVIEFMNKIPGVNIDLGEEQQGGGGGGSNLSTAQVMENAQIANQNQPGGTGQGGIASVAPNVYASSGTGSGTTSSGETLYDPGSGGHTMLPMARGGVVTSPTRALIGEQGPEVVLPLEDFQKTAVTQNTAPTPARDTQSTRELLDKLDEVIIALEDLDMQPVIELDNKRLSKAVKQGEEKYFNPTDVVK